MASEEDILGHFKSVSGRFEREKLTFDITTGKLRMVKAGSTYTDNVTYPNLASSGFFGASFAAPPEKNKLVISPQSMASEKDIQGHLESVSWGFKPQGVLEFDMTTGLHKLRMVEAHSNDNIVAPKMASLGFYGGSFAAPPERNKLVIRPQSFDKNSVEVETMHISCKSDIYRGSAYNYGGVIIYLYHGRAEWKTANNTHCKSGYLVIQDTNSVEVKRFDSEPGIVHGAVYRNAFGESVDKEVVGEGFSIRNGKFEINSGVFNNPIGSVYHNEHRWMHKLSEHCVRKVVESWMTAGPCFLECRNFTVKELLQDFSEW